MVIDNGSTDDSVEMIREYSRGDVRIDTPLIKYSIDNKPLNVCEIDVESKNNPIRYDDSLLECRSNRGFILIKNPRNEGFADGNNIGINYAMQSLKPRYILLLNNDTIVDRELLNNLVSCASTIDGIGIEGPRINFYDRPDTISSAGGVINFWKGSTPQYDELNDPPKANKQIYDVDFVSGCALFIDTEIFKSVELFDEKFFLYWEDIDLCYRTKKSGYRIICNRDAVIWHKISQSFNKVSTVAVYYGHRNQILFMRKQATPFQKIVFIYYFVLIQFPFRLSTLLSRPKSNVLLSYFLKGIFDGFLDRSSKDSP